MLIRLTNIVQEMLRLSLYQLKTMLTPRGLKGGVFLLEQMHFKANIYLYAKMSTVRCS